MVEGVFEKFWEKRALGEGLHGPREAFLRIERGLWGS